MRVLFRLTLECIHDMHQVLRRKRGETYMHFFYIKNCTFEYRYPQQIIFFPLILSVWSDRRNQKLMDCSKFIELLLGSLRGLISVWNVDTLLCISSYYTPIINSHQLKLSLCKCIEYSEHVKFLKTSQGPTHSKWFSLFWSKITHG